MPGDVEKNDRNKSTTAVLEKSVEKEDPHGGSDHPTSYLETMMHMFKGNVGAGLSLLWVMLSRMVV